MAQGAKQLQKFKQQMLRHVSQDPKRKKDPEPDENAEEKRPCNLRDTDAPDNEAHPETNPLDRSLAKDETAVVPVPQSELKPCIERIIQVAPLTIADPLGSSLLAKAKQALAQDQRAASRGHEEDTKQRILSSALSMFAQSRRSKTSASLPLFIEAPNQQPVSLSSHQLPTGRSHTLPMQANVQIQGLSAEDGPGDEGQVESHD